MGRPGVLLWMLVLPPTWLAWGCLGDGGEDAAAETSASDISTGAETASPPQDSVADSVAPPNETSGSDDDATTPPDPTRNPVGEAVTLALEGFEVAPGSERQVCKTINLPADADLDLVRIRSTMVGNSHHFNLYKVIDQRALEPVSAAESTLHDCQPADEQLSGDAAYIFGSATPERTWDSPRGVAFALQPGQRLILEQHVINFTQKPIEGGVVVELFDAGADAVIEHHADIIWAANWGFFLPGGQQTSSTKRCVVPYDVEVFGLMSHFHELGVEFTVDTLTAEGETRVYRDDDWAHPAYQEYDPPLRLAAGDALQWTCTWDNTRSSAVFPGKDSTDEMCILFAAAYPSNALDADPIQCNLLF